MAANLEAKRSDWRSRSEGRSCPLKVGGGGGGGGGGVALEGYVEEDRAPGGFSRTMSLTDEDLEDLRGCFDLGFGFSYSEIPELRGTLPALELCYSMSPSIHPDDQPADRCSPPASPPLASWRISSPGDDPKEVKARIKYWAQAVACTLKLCS